MNFLVPVLQTKKNGQIVYKTLGPFELVEVGSNAARVGEALTRRLKAAIAEEDAQVARRLADVGALRLERVRVELDARGPGRRSFSGVVPLIVESRWANPKERFVFAYHPHRTGEWFPVGPDETDLGSRASRYFREAWAALSEDGLADLTATGKERLVVLAFDAEPRPPRLPGPEGREKTSRPGGLRPLVVLPAIGEDLTALAAVGRLSLGRPRGPYREQLTTLLSGAGRRSTVLVGSSGSGKTTLVHRWVSDLLEDEDFPSHQNLDRVTHVWRIAGQRLIAGMSRIGDWEMRARDLLGELEGRRVVLFAEDLFAFARLGQARDAERALSDFFRGPVARREAVLVGECTKETFAVLEEEAPSFAALFTRLEVRETSIDETLDLMFQAVREIERRDGKVFDVSIYRPIVELSAALFPFSAFPGKALDALEGIARASVDGRPIDEAAVLEHFSAQTGLSRDILAPEGALEPRLFAERFSGRVMGQPVAIDAAVDVTLRIRQGLSDPRRPSYVLLFTGPTGTGKTELAKAMAEHIYGSARRLLRIDMAELTTPDAPSRLIGDRSRPDGLLTAPIRAEPFSVVLLDEIEKAHPTVMNLLLQLFDEGRLTDAHGRVSDFTRAVIVMTSNLGARLRSPVGFDEAPGAQAHEVTRAVKAFFSPELFNRIDRVVPFGPLSAEAARAVADKELAALLSRRGLVARGVFVSANRKVLDKVVEEGFDPELGARTVKRYLEDHIEVLLTRALTRARPQEGPAGGLRHLGALRVYPSASGFALHESPLVEADRRALRDTGVSILAPTRDQGLAALEAAERALFLRVESGALLALFDAIGERLSENPSDPELEVLDGIRSEVEDHVRATFAADPAEAWDAFEEFGEGPGGLPVRIEAPAAPRDGSVADRASWTTEDLLRKAAAVRGWAREIDRPASRGRHLARIEVLRVGPMPSIARPEDALVPQLVTSLLRTGSGPRVRLLGVATRRDGGAIETLALAPDRGGAGARSEEAEPGLPIALERGRALAHVVLDLAGPGARDLREREEGTHALVTWTGETQLAVVRFGPVDLGRSPEAVLREAEWARARFEAAIEREDEELPQDPEALLPLVRRIELRGRGSSGASPEYWIEDLRLGIRYARRAGRLAEALEPIMWQWALQPEGEP